jgi:hypothetical protein
VEIQPLTLALALRITAWLTEMPHSPSLGRTADHHLLLLLTQLHNIHRCGGEDNERGKTLLVPATTLDDRGFAAKRNPRNARGATAWRAKR